eukprot:CAMPEP_0204021260 /NCGR_PEP_ID=MMETSP0360-20130528/29980_1 /ASSEMBLY_ACC=CAM_ASM_000342 /TAXON_ID=268821 /ORGANISM="Scrippsiella Hangoei, Strain SHTV-5" /LENGTH=72 /DNA_ID=CAMNT_0050964647 /DNA_START=196 /DNA_END=410 /DNA_ORIENTATION=-
MASFRFWWASAKSPLAFALLTSCALQMAMRPMHQQQQMQANSAAQMGSSAGSPYCWPPGKMPPPESMPPQPG